MLVRYFEKVYLVSLPRYGRPWSAKTEALETADRFGQRRRIVAHTKRFPTNPNQNFKRLVTETAIFQAAVYTAKRVSGVKLDFLDL